jgi:transposase
VNVHCITQGVAAYRSAYLIEQGFGRLKGRALSLTPLLLRDDQRVVALICLLRIALRVLVLMPCIVRRHLQQGGTTRKGLPRANRGGRRRSRRRRCCCGLSAG